MNDEKKAKSLCKEIFKDFKEYADRFEHSKRVVNLCEEMAEKLNVKDINILVKAAWLHDVGKIMNNKEHHK